MRVMDRILDDLETIVPRHAFGMDVDWEVQIAMIPMQDGNTMIAAQFFFFTPSPILGQGDLVSVTGMPLALTKLPDAIDGMVRQAIANLSDQQSQALLGPK